MAESVDIIVALKGINPDFPSCVVEGDRGIASLPEEALTSLFVLW
jgi:hypothetical protein